MKRLTWTMFVAFCASALTILAISALSPGNPGAMADDNGPRVISLEELARHNTADDCWKAIRGKVYDFTDYIPLHPTPPFIMTQWCGKESTEAYDTKGYGRPHSAAADAMLERYFIGVLDASSD